MIPFELRMAISSELEWFGINPIDVRNAWMFMYRKIDNKKYSRQTIKAVMFHADLWFQPFP